MPNASVIDRMRGLLEEYMSHALSPEEFELAIEQHIVALEHIHSDTVHQSRHLCGRLVNAHHTENEEFGIPGELSTVVEQMRKFIDSLPTGPV